MEAAFRVGIDMAGEIGDDEEQIADFLADRRLVAECERLLDFGGLFTDLVEHEPGIVPIETDGRGFGLEFPGAAEGWQTLGDTRQHALVLDLIG